MSPLPRVAPLVLKRRAQGPSMSTKTTTRLSMNERRWRGALLLIVLLGSAIALSYAAWPVLFPDESWPALLPDQYP